MQQDVTQIKKIRRSRAALAGAYAVIGGVALATAHQYTSESNTAGGAVIGAMSAHSLGSVTRDYNAELKSLADTVRYAGLIRPEFAPEHISEDELRKNFTHLFVRRNGNVVLTNEHSAWEFITGLKRTRVRLPRA